MKKFAALLLVLMLCLGTALAETADVIGTWRLNEVVIFGESITPASLDLDITMTLNENERATTVSGEETMSSYWALNGDKYITPLSGGLLVFTPQDGRLVGDLNGTQMIFVRAFDLGAARFDATMADYNGTWNATLVDYQGVQMSVAEMGMMMQIIVADGEITILQGEGEEITTTEGTATTGGGVLDVGLKGDPEPTHLQLHEGGVLAWVTDVEGMPMGIYFEKAAE